jgi:hypothetical protein
MSGLESAEPSFFALQRTMLADAHARSHGVRECWLPQTTDTVLAFALSGPPVRCALGPKTGAVITPLSQIARSGAYRRSTG